MLEEEIVKLYENLSLADEDRTIHELHRIQLNLAVGPSYFDKSLIVLEKPDGTKDISLLGFDRVELYVQIHKVPIMCMNRKTVRWLSDQIGKVVDIPAESKECWGKFMKVKVHIDISKPLKRWLRLKLDKSDKMVVVGLKYEKLPEFCYACGGALVGKVKPREELCKEVDNGLLGSGSASLGFENGDPKTIGLFARRKTIVDHSKTLATISDFGPSPTQGKWATGPIEVPSQENHDPDVMISNSKHVPATMTSEPKEMKPKGLVLPKRPKSNSINQDKMLTKSGLRSEMQISPYKGNARK
ncbi:hypothetical protein Ddye_018712 [Dipteronia dyeriana]|uniref:Zinc knuckle CX2CX4HX4C domain-containing protein n=1 Tax=Dipteronia dyeriana TaxID=168575 RepID=A0AAD9UBJ8_9ROSI|nr:hypothetical protein Ddye_018712 [Dipteronia dyeriana]